jgi:cation diffusion facilitator CzcD-associated flavoprotein CzcO
MVFTFQIPSHSYQYSFNPNPSWSSLYAPSKEIQQYLEGTAKKFGTDRFVKLRHRVEGCEWRESDGRWYVTIKDLQTGEDFVDKADLLVTARGNLNNVKWPQIEGLGSFTGRKMHSAQWDERCI